MPHFQIHHIPHRPRKYFATSSVGIEPFASHPVFRGRKNFDADDYDKLRDPQNDAGIIIITYDEWYDLLEPLVDMHAQYQEEPLHAVRVKLSRYL